MFTVFLIMLAGIGLGAALRPVPSLKHTSRLIMFVIYLLLFLLGKEASEDERVMSSLDTLGLQALMITAAAIIGSVLAARFVYLCFFKSHER